MRLPGGLEPRGRIDGLGLYCLLVAVVIAVVGIATNSGNSALQHGHWLGEPVSDAVWAFFIAGCALRVWGQRRPRRQLDSAKK